MTRVSLRVEGVKDGRAPDTALHKVEMSFQNVFFFTALL